MILTCPRCTTSWVLDDARLPPGGADVRCTRCDTVFPVAGPPAVHPALAMLLAHAAGRFGHLHYGGPAPALDEQGTAHAMVYLQLAATGAPVREPTDAHAREWRYTLQLHSNDRERAMSAFVRALLPRLMGTNRLAEIAAHFDTYLCELELGRVLERAPRPLGRHHILLRAGVRGPGRCDTWWLETGDHFTFVSAQGDDIELVEGSGDDTFALLPDAVARTAPEALRARYLRLRT